MKYCVDIPNFGPWADPARVARLAADVEAGGWDGLSIWDHILVADGTEVGDPWVALAAAAVATQRLTLMSMVTPLPRRTPWKLARECVSLDHLSAGRLVLGVGLGWPTDPEFTRFGGETDLRRRAEMLDEALEILTGLWSGAPFAFEGKHYRLEKVHFLPRPVQRPRIPIWVAVMWPRRRPLRRAARYDGVAPIVYTGGEFAPITPEIVSEIATYVADHREPGAAFDLAVAGMACGRGGVADEIEEMEAAGATWWREGWTPGSIAPEAWLEAVRNGPPGTHGR